MYLYFIFYCLGKQNLRLEVCILFEIGCNTSKKMLKLKILKASNSLSDQKKKKIG